MLMRENIYDMVEQIKPVDALETEHRDNVLHWIKSGVEIFRIQKPATPPKHLVSYFVVIDPKLERVLLVDHLKAQLWLPAGGHVEVNEDPRTTVIREAKEELFLDARFVYQDPLFITETITVGLTAGHTDVSLWFVIEADSSKIIQFDPAEFKGVCWFSYPEILEMNIDTLDPHMHRFMKKLIRQNSNV